MWFVNMFLSMILSETAGTLIYSSVNVRMTYVIFLDSWGPRLGLWRLSSGVCHEGTTTFHWVVITGLTLRLWCVDHYCVHSVWLIWTGYCWIYCCVRIHVLITDILSHFEMLVGTFWWMIVMSCSFAMRFLLAEYFDSYSSQCAGESSGSGQKV